MRQTKNLMNININALYNILKQNQEKVVVSLDSKGSGTDDFSELKKITALLAKAFNRRKFYSKPANKNLRTSSTSQSANKKQVFVKSDDKKEDNKADEKKMDMRKVKCYNFNKEGHFAKDCKKAKLLWIFDKRQDESRRATIGSTMRISLLYRGEYSQWVERFMNYLEEQTDGEAMINSIKNGDQPLPRVTQVSIAGISSTEQPPLKDKSMWSDQEKKIQKIDHLARSLLIQGLPNDIYSLIDSNKTAKDLRDALARHMIGSVYGEQDRKAVVLYEYETFKATKEELLLDTYIRYLQNKNLMDINIDALYNILKQNQGNVNDAMGLKKKTVVVTSDPLALIAEKMKVSKRKEKLLFLRILKEVMQMISVN
nr:DUF4219 domain-containing protein/UBN2 domain-containing protein [Tanacetum cinerariifolium]